MKSIIELILKLDERDIRVSVEDGKLLVNSPTAEIEESVLNEIRLNRQQLIAYLSGSSSKTYNGIPLTRKADSYAVSSAQHRLWIMCQLKECNAAYNMPAIYRLQGDLDLQALEESFNELIVRHEILRTVLVEDGQGEVRQLIRPLGECTFSMSFMDLRDEVLPEATADNHIQANSAMPFEMAEGPLLRACIYLVKDREWIISYTMHHIISDEWSMKVVMKELIALYTAAVKKQEHPLAPLKIQYKDYTAWQLGQLSGDEMKIHKEYWLTQLGGNLPVLELPFDRSRPSVKTYNGSAISISLGEKLSKAVRTLSQNNESTLFMGLLAAVKVLLFRYTNQSDIIVGSPIAGRYHADLSEQIGFYVNMLALRTRFSAEDSYQQLLAKVRTTTLEAFEHQSFPFDVLVEELGHIGDRSRHALFDVAVVLEDKEDTMKELGENPGGLIVHEYESSERPVSLFDLRFIFKATGNDIRTIIEYNTDIYNVERIERLGEDFKRLLSSIVREPDQAVYHLDYINPLEISALLESTKKEIYPDNRTIVDLFEEQVRETPHKAALVSGGQTLTYKELNEMSNRIAHFLINDIHLQKEEGVGLLLDPSAESIAGMLGILKAGGMYLPMEPDMPEDRLRFIISDAQLRTLITEKKHMELANRLQWSDKCLQSYLCIDSDEVYDEKEVLENPMMNQELWDHVGEKATDNITGGGWINSFTGNAIATEEMEEYAMNAYRKLIPFVNNNTRVLEIGCSSGLTLCKIAPFAGAYYATDLSPVILRNTSAMADAKGWHHMKFLCLAAHEIDRIAEGKFDVIILNSVIQHFHGHNYLRKVIKKCITLLNESGRIFIGDVMDIEKKDQLIRDSQQFDAMNKQRDFATKTDWSAELFVAKGFFEDLVTDEAAISAIEVSSKNYSIENELTKYRYDVLLKINRGAAEKHIHGLKNKMQFSNTVINSQPSHDPGLSITGDNLAYTIYTSGTTGRPKGTLIEHINVVRLFTTDKPLFDFDGDDVWTMFHSYSFDFSVWEMYGALLHGGKLVLVNRLTARDPAALLALLETEAVTVLNQTPSAFYQLERAIWSLPDPALRLRYIIFGGEALNAGKLSKWKARYPHVKLINMYGITETTVHVTYKELATLDLPGNRNNIGKPMPSMECFVLDPYRQLLPWGVPGELYVGGAGIARGYLNRKELTEEKFVAHPFRKGQRLYRSGDRVALLPNGELEYLGRLDDQVKVRGYRIELGEIEHAIQSVPEVTLAVVLPVANTEGEYELVAWVVSSAQLNASSIRNYLSKQLPPYMLPVKYLQLAQLPLTQNGKADKKALLWMESGELGTGNLYIGARNETEEKLVAVWKTILGKEAVSVKDDFFELGGHSIKATRLAGQIHKIFDVKVALRDLFSHTVLEDQATLIQEAVKSRFSSIPVLPSQLDYAISAAQRRLWILCQVEEANTAYNIPWVFMLEGELNKDVLRESFMALIRRHEVLRTAFCENAQGEVRQYILPAGSASFDLRYEDLRQEQHAEEKLKMMIKEEFNTSFDLSKGPLLRAGLYQIGEKRWTLIFTIHHIITDGWSKEVFKNDLLALYNAFVKGLPDPLQPLAIQYKDYADWQNQQLTLPSMNIHREYWVKKLAGERSVVTIPTDFPRPVMKSYKGSSVDLCVNEKDTADLKRLSEKTGASLFMVLMSVIKILIYKYTGEEDIIIGSPIAGREHPDLEDQIGFYVNTLLLRDRIKGSDNIATVLEKVKITILEAYEHQAYPFDKLIEELAVPGDMKMNPLFEIMTVLQNADQREDVLEVDEAKLKVRHMEYEKETSRFDINFNMQEHGTGIHVMIEYNSDLYEQALIILLGEKFLQMIDICCADQEILIEDIELFNSPVAEEVSLEWDI